MKPKATPKRAKAPAIEEAATTEPKQPPFLGSSEVLEEELLLVEELSEVAEEVLSEVEEEVLPPLSERIAWLSSKSKSSLVIWMMSIPV